MSESKEKGSGKQKFSEFMQKTAVATKKVAKDAYDGTKIMAERIKESSEKHKKERLAPLFPNDYKSQDFRIPNVIKIVDDATRKNIEMCQGAIGWLAMEGVGKDTQKTEVLYLYDEARDMCGLEFVPSFNINAIYCIDTFDLTKKRFIKADCIFNKAQEEKMAELEKVAYSLGAKSYSVDIVSTEIEASSKNNTKNVKVVDKEVDEEKEPRDLSTNFGCGNTNSQRRHVSGHASASFEGHNSPVAPTLKWFMYDDTVKNLIEMRCSNPASVKSRTLELSGASSATMSRQTAVAIDCMIKGAKVKSSSNMEMQANRELSSKLIFKIEF